MKPAGRLKGAIALDLDGTALDSGGRLRPRTLEAVARAAKAGVATVLTSGRHHSAVRVYHHELKLTTPAVCCNGTYLYDFAAGRAIAGAGMTKATAQRALRICRDHESMLALYVDDAMVYETLTPHLERLIAWGEALPTPLRPNFVKGPRFETAIDEGQKIWKLLASHAEASRLSACRDELFAQSDLAVEYSWRDRLDVCPGGVGKGKRLLEWAAQNALEPEMVIAFGDSENDVEMLTKFEGVAMGNANAAAKAAAKRVIGDNDSDALAEEIERWLERLK
jgi:Cof subfamily protein (haloacid dehalogenase superfamily)